MSYAGEADREPTFAPPTDKTPCPDCRERARQGRDELRNMHRPRRMTFPLHAGGEVKCESCHGAGYLKLDRLQRDPYDLEEKESRDQLAALQLHRLRTPPPSRAT